MKEEHVEVKRKHGPSFGERLVIHLDAVVAVACGIALVLQLAGVLFTPDPALEKALVESEATLASLDRSLATNAFPVEERFAAVEQSVGALVTTFKHGTPPAAETPAGLTYSPGYIRTLKPGESNEIRLLPPVDVKAVPQAGGIEVTWVQPAGNNIPIGRYEVLRSENQGAEAKVAEVAGTVHSHVDTALKPGHEYTYRIVAVAADKDLSETARGRTAPSPPATTRAIADFKIELVDLDGEEAVFKVSRYSDKTWRDRTFRVRQGGTIGGRDEATGLDFSTGRKLDSIQVETADVEVTREEVVFDSKGRVVVEGGAPRRVTVSSNEPTRRVRAALSGADLPEETLELEKR